MSKQYSWHLAGAGILAISLGFGLLSIPLAAKLIHGAKSIIDGIEVCNAQDLIGTVLNSHKTLLAFVRQHSLGRKLLLSLSLQDQNELICPHTDVLLFRTPANIIAAFQSKTLSIFKRRTELHSIKSY